MRSEFINPFVIAAAEVLEKETGAAVERGRLSTENSAYTSQSITTLVGLTGGLQGIVLYGLSEKTARNIVSKMTGERCVIIDDMAQSAIGELGNMITGRASIELANITDTVRLSPPILIIGSGVLISTLDIKRLVIPLNTQHGPLEIQVALR